MVTVRRVVCLLAAALCCTALCVTAAATEESAVSSSDIKARIALHEAEVEKAKAAIEGAKKKEQTTKGSEAALKETKEAAEKALEVVEAIKMNADAVKKNALAVSSAISNVSRAAITLKNLKEPLKEADPKKAEEKKADAERAKEEITALMPGVVQTVLDADGVVQKIKNAKAKADEALRHLSLAGAEPTDAEAYITKTEREAKATVEGARTAVGAALVAAEMAREVALIHKNAATEAEAAVQEAMKVIPTITEKPTDEQKERLKAAQNITMRAYNRVKQAMLESKAANNGEEVAGSVKQALTTVETTLEAAAASMKAILSARTAAETSLQNAQQQLEQLKDKAHRVEREE
ncbi:hypothetical protein DQ04_08931030, partial [Trypanosoma grayi]|uniref:hypothetical protein n=1 Tax=Trypanosoma grayi TaxID=71804 RepID=UPI0004F409BC